MTEETGGDPGPRADPVGARRRAYALAALLGLAGAVHLRRPQVFDAIVPEFLPGPARTYTLASGVAELAVAAALAVPGTRRLGGMLAAGYFVAVFPANVKMAVDALARPGTGTGAKVGVLARLPLQVPMVTEAWKVARTRR